ncbi:MAG TPA: hypothetical protein VIV12_05425 [Streptosporangiaceae bacterium]
MQPATGDPEIDVPASQMRQLARALAGGGARGLIAPAAAVVTQRGAGANFSVDVGAFQAIVDGTDVADQGDYLLTQTATVNVVTPTAPASGTRTHRLIARVRDKRSNATYTTYDFLLDLLQDTGSGEPALPASSLTLAHISIAAGQANVSNSNITQGYSVLKDLVYRGPWRSLQTAAAAWSGTGAWNDFPGGSWPALTFTVPPSGMVYVTIGGAINPASGTSTFSWRISGTDTVAADMAQAFSVGGAYTGRGSRRKLVTGLTPGASDTVTPRWWQSQTGTSDDANGELLVEAAGG